MTLVKLNVTYAINHYSCPDQINRFEGKRASEKSFTAVCLKSPATRFNLIYFFLYRRRRVDFSILTPCASLFFDCSCMIVLLFLCLPLHVVALLETGKKMAKGQVASKRKDGLDTSSSDTLYQRKAISRPFYFRISIFIYDFEEYVITRFNKEQKRLLSNCRRLCPF